jgi:hypothetical protein
MKLLIIHPKTVDTFRKFTIILALVLSLLPSCKKEDSNMSYFTLDRIEMNLYEGYERTLYFSVYPPIKTEWRFENIPTYLTIMPSSGVINHNIAEVKIIVDTAIRYNSDIILLKAKGVYNNHIYFNCYYWETN